LSKIQVDTIDTRSGTSTMQIGSTNTSTINLGVSGHTVNIPSGVTIANAGTATGFGGTNTPFFKVALSASQSNVGTSNVKINFNHRLIDPDSVFDISNYRFLPTTAGKYFFNVNTRLYSSNANADMTLRLYKNGSEVDRLSEQKHEGSNYSILVGSSIQEANGSSDYIEVYVMINQNTADITADPSNYTWSYFEGFKLIT